MANKDTAMAGHLPEKAEASLMYPVTIAVRKHMYLRM